MAYRLGVDLGTTFVAAAISYDSGIEMVTLGDRSVVTPSVVFLREDGALVTGEPAQRRAPNSPDRVAREFKRRLGDPTPVILGGQAHAVTDLIGAVLRDVLAKVSEVEGEQPEHVVLTHPANWGPFRRGLFEEVPRIAGLPETVSTTTEPEAAAAHYVATRKLSEGDTVAVYDLGGGTFDVTVLRKQAEGMEILGVPEGIERLGGIDFDEAILSHINFASDGALAELDIRDPQNAIALARLRQDCVLAKESLSVDTETLIPVFLPGRNFDVTITREDFEKLVRAQVESTIGALSRTLRSARVEPTELSAVLLVGGSSRIPLVAQMVSDEIGRPIVVDTHPKYAVALGAATVAAQATLQPAAPASPTSGSASPTSGSASPTSGSASPTSGSAKPAPVPAVATAGLGTDRPPAASGASAPEARAASSATSDAPAAPASPSAGAPGPGQSEASQSRGAQAPPAAWPQPPGQHGPGPQSPGPQSPGQQSPGPQSPGQPPPRGQQGPGQAPPGQQSPGQTPSGQQPPGQQGLAPRPPGPGQPQPGQQSGPYPAQYPGQGGGYPSHYPPYQEQYPGQYPGQYPQGQPGQYGGYPGQHPGQYGQQYPQSWPQGQTGGGSAGRTIAYWMGMIALAIVVAFLAYTVVSKLRGG